MGRSMADKRRDEFLDACEAGDVAKARSMLEKGQTPEPTNTDFHPPLARAVYHPEMVETLLKAGARPDDPFFLDPFDVEGAEPVVFFATSDEVPYESFRLLVEAGAPLYRKKDGEPEYEGLLHRVAGETRGGDLAAAKAMLLLSKGADPDREDARGRTPLMLASGASLVDVLMKAGAKVDERVKPLHNCAVCGRDEDVERLVRMGFDPNELGTPPMLGTRGNAPAPALHYAARYDNANVCTELLRVGADPEIKDARGESIDGLMRDDRVRATITAHREAKAFEEQLGPRDEGGPAENSGRRRRM